MYDRGLPVWNDRRREGGEGQHAGYRFYLFESEVSRSIFTTAGIVAYVRTALYRTWCAGTASLPESVSPEALIKLPSRRNNGPIKAGYEFTR